MLIFIYSLSFHLLNGYITNSHNDPLPVGLIAQLVEHCTGVSSAVHMNFHIFTFRKLFIRIQEESWWCC